MREDEMVPAAKDPGVRINCGMAARWLVKRSVSARKAFTCPRSVQAAPAPTADMSPRSTRVHAASRHVEVTGAVTHTCSVSFERIRMRTSQSETRNLTLTHSLTHSLTRPPKYPLLTHPPRMLAAQRSCRLSENAYRSQLDDRCSNVLWMGGCLWS